MSPDTSNTSSFRVLTSLGCTRTADKLCGVDQETLKQNLIRAAIKL